MYSLSAQGVVELIINVRSSSSSDYLIVQIRIGNGINVNRSYIRTRWFALGSRPAARKITEVPNAQPLMDCCSFRTFWVKWNATTVQVGKGMAVGSDTILYQSSSLTLNIRFLSLRGRGGVRKEVIFGGF